MKKSIKDVILRRFCYPHRRKIEARFICVNRASVLRSIEGRRGLLGDAVGSAHHIICVAGHRPVRRLGLPADGSRAAFNVRNLHLVRTDVVADCCRGGHRQVLGRAGAPHEGSGQGKSTHDHRPPLKDLHLNAFLLGNRRSCGMQSS